MLLFVHYHFINLGFAPNMYRMLEVKQIPIRANIISFIPTMNVTISQYGLCTQAKITDNKMIIPAIRTVILSSYQLSVWAIYIVIPPIVHFAVLLFIIGLIHEIVWLPTKALRGSLDRICRIHGIKLILNILFILSNNNRFYQRSIQFFTKLQQQGVRSSFFTPR